MDSKERYKQLIKENNETIGYLSDSYQNIANIYIKKARGYANKSLETEVKIKKVLEELTSFDEKNLNVNLAIPNISVYVEGNIAKLSKAVHSKYKVTEIIAVSIFILLIIGYFVANFWLNKKHPLPAPQNISVAVRQDRNNCFYLTWDPNDYATEGYYVMIYENDKLIKEVDVQKQVDTNIKKQYYQTDIVYDDTKQYKFAIKIQETNEYEESEVSIIFYPINKNV